MNRKSKVIVSIVGITIVLLALLGITYAYYLTRIEGNTNTNSISITTANLKLAYGDGNEIITASNIVPNTTIAEKTFIVTNTGNTTIENYRVILELASIEGVVPSVFKYPNDFEITMTCVSKNNTTNEASGTCNGYNGTWNNESFEMQKNTIEAGIRHEYSLSIKYIDSGIDQSDDMGKNLNLKVQIYGETDTSTLNGTITGVDSTYAMKLNSNPKVSALKPTGNTGEYRYSFTGVEPGTHTLSLINKEGVVVSSETITINKGTNTNVSGSTITVSENESTIHLTTSNSGSTLTSVATFNPYNNNTNSLAYHIINNAKENKNGTIYSDNPLSVPSVQTSLFAYKSHEAIVATTATNMSVNTTYQGYYWTYAFDYRVDEKNGRFELIEPKTCKYNTNGCISDLINNGETIYLVASYDSGNANESNKLKTSKDLYYIYVVTSAPPSNSSTISLKVKQLKPIPYATEKVLSVTNDDLGTSYYFRGGVEDNYVNFAGMCWRIIRIEGDGSIKLILEDRSYECNNVSFTGNWRDSKGYLFGNDANNKTDFVNYVGGLADSFRTFQSSKFSANEIEKLKVDEWCYDDKITQTASYGYYFDSVTGEPIHTTNRDEAEDWFIDEYYGAYTRIVKNKKPSLSCSGAKLTKFRDNTDMYVGTITADEMVFAGVIPNKSNYGIYLSNDLFTMGNFWSLSPIYYTGNVNTSYRLDANAQLIGGFASVTSHSRPAVTLKTGTIITSGDGTQSNPYIIG